MIRSPALWILPFLLLAASGARASPIISLSSAADLAHLGVGQSFTVNVSLSGLTAGAALENLAATVKYDGTLLGSPGTIIPGPIVPDPLADPLDFLTASGPGLADASFQTFSTSPSKQIQANGTFFSFTIIPLSAGSGQFFFDFTDALQFNAASPSNPIDPGLVAGQILTFTAVVPEPASILILAVSSWFFLKRRNHRLA